MIPIATEDGRQIMIHKNVAIIFLLLGVMSLGIIGCGADDDSPVAVPVRDQYLHVAVDGRLFGDGSKATPQSRPGDAIAKAFAEGYRGVKIAAGDYPSYLSDNGLQIYGGIDIIGGCDRETWEPVPGQLSRISTSWPAMRGLSVRTPTLVQGLELTGFRTFWTVPTSNALYLDGCSADLRFQQCRFVAEPGYSYINKGRDGEERTLPIGPMPGGPGACAESVLAEGGDRGSNGERGGRGGDGGLPGQPGAYGWGPTDSYYNTLETPGGAVGQDGQDGRHGDHGDDGENAEPPVALGRVLYSSFVPHWTTSGATGQTGAGGAGGGGGGGSTNGTGNGGGGGGTGGRGGESGESGSSGGHSIGMISINSDAVFVQCEFVAGPGGNGSDGGNGGLGAGGTDGALGGEACPDEVGRGGRGGNGGDGGAGGAGAGGNGGASFGVILLGAIQPDFDEACSFVSDVPGQAGSGGLNGNGLSRAEDGYAGESVGVKIILAKDGTQTRQ